MEDLSQALEDKTDIIIERWIAAVYRASEIQSTRELSYEAVRNSLPTVLTELAALLSTSQAGRPQKLEDKSLYHGFLRAQQGYDTTEITREYRLLREVILDTLESDLTGGSPQETLQAVRAISSFLDQIVSASLESYVEARLIELKQMQSQLMLTNRELNRLLDVQKENLSFMAHELKNPLNSIIGHSNLLLQQQRKKIKERDASTNLEQLERVLRNGRKLLTIINDSLEISRYSQGQVQLNLEPVNVCDLIQETLEDILEPAAAEKGLALLAEIEQAPQQIISDTSRLQQLVTNLVSNAIRYTEEGRVQVICQQLDPQSWMLVVSDTGIGIASEDQARIFEPYTQIRSPAQVGVGSGLGLAIVKQVVELMQGTITLTSEVAQGTEITVTLPLTLSEKQNIPPSKTPQNKTIKWTN